MSATISHAALPKHLIPASLAYLGLPTVIFLFGWLRWSLALPAAGLLLAAAFVLARDERRVSLVSGDPPVELPLVQVWLTVLVALFLLLLSGVGGYGPQTGDWAKHSAILKDLIQKPWPVMYQYEGQTFQLVYYIAYYLPAALAGKYAGWNAANQALFVWSLFGVVLVLLWFQLLIGRFGIGPIALFVLFSGLDALGVLVRYAPSGDWNWREIIRSINWWANNWLYGSSVDSLWWTPHMAIAGWILGALALNSVLGRGCARNGLFYLGLSPLWSPFLSIGIVGYLALGWVSERAFLRKLRVSCSLPNLCGAVLLALYGLYFVSKFYPPLPPGGTPVHGWIFVAPLTPDWHWTRVAAMMILFCALEFGCYALVLWRCAPQSDARGGTILTATTAFLFLLPLYRYGQFNDLVMRASIPGLFVLSILVGRTFFDIAASVRCRSLLAILLVAGAVTPLSQALRHAGAVYKSRTLDFRPQVGEVKDLYALHQQALQKWSGFLGQYTGSDESPFFRYLAKPRSGHGGLAPQERGNSER